MKEKLKKSSGITLIALIITIIVMLILVAVTVTLANENGGLFVTTRKAASETQAAAEKETLSAELVGAMKAGGEFDISAVNLPDNMKWCDKDDNDFNSVSKGQPSKGEASWVITKNNNKFYVNENGNLSDTAPMTWEEAYEKYVKEWVYSDNGAERILLYVGNEKNVSIAKVISNVPIFKTIGDGGNTTFEGIKNLDITEDGIEISFIDNESIEQVDFGELEITLAGECFSGCKKLKSISGIDKITAIDYGVFKGCESLTNITLPSSITSINSAAFEGCTNLTQITINKAQDSISGAPWGAPNATVTWQE